MNFENPPQSNPKQSLTQAYISEQNFYNFNVVFLFWGVFGHTNLVAELQEQVSGRFSSKKPPNLRSQKREIPQIRFSSLMGSDIKLETCNWASIILMAFLMDTISHYNTHSFSHDTVYVFQAPTGEISHSASPTLQQKSSSAGLGKIWM